MIFGFFVCPIFMARFGRRWVFASYTIILVIAWMIIYFATNITTLMIGRLVGGLAIASMYCSGCTIVAEYTAPEIRGLFLNIKTLILYCGYLYMHVVGHYLHWRTVALLSITPCVISLLNNLTWPESPFWLASKNRFQECADHFYYLRGRDEKTVKELESIIRAQKLKKSHLLETMSFSEKVVNFAKKFKQKNFLKPLAIVFFLGILCETSGRHFFPAYAVDIIMEITHDKENSLYYIIGVDLLSLVSAIISCILIKVIGRKPLLFFSGITATVLLLTISLVSYLISRGFEMPGNPWLVPTLVGTFFVVANLGCTAIPFVIYAEIFPMAHRECGAGLGGATLTFTFFIYLKVMPYLLTNLKLHGMFAVFSVGMVVSLVYLYFEMPETRNRTLQEIEEYLDHGRYLDGENRRSNEDDAKELMLIKEKTPVIRVLASD